MKLDEELLVGFRRNILLYTVFLVLYWIFGMTLNLWENTYYRFGFLIIGLILIHESARGYRHENKRKKSLIYLILTLTLLLASIVMLLFFR